MVERTSPDLRETTGIARAAGAVFFGTGALALILVALVLSALNIAPLRHAALERALAEINRGGTTISIGDMEGRWPTTLVVKRLTVSDAEGQWLSLGSAELRWRPSALLAGKFSIERLAVSGLDISRAPRSTEPAPAGETSGFSLPVLPIAIEIDEAKFENLSLGKALADPQAQGTLATLEAEARFLLAPSQIDLSLAAARTDRTPGRIDARVFFDRRNSGLDLRVQGEDGAAGKPGLVATLAKLEGVERLSIDAAARNENGHVAGHARIDGGKVIAIEARAEGRWDSALDIDASARAEGDMAARLLADLGRPRVIEAASKIGWGRDDTLKLDNIALAAGELRLEGSAAIANASSAVPHDLKAQGTLAGLDRLLDAPGNAALTPLAWRIGAKLDMRANIARIAEAAISTPAGEIRLSGEAALDGSTAKGKAEAAISDLAPLGALAGQKLAGEAKITLSPFALDPAGEFAGDFTMEGRSLDFADEALNRLAGNALSADGSIILPKDGGFALPSFTVTPASGHFHLRGNLASGPTDLLSGEAHFETGDATKLPGGDEISGALTADATIGGTLVAPSLALKAELSKGSIAGFDARLATLDATATIAGSGPLAFRLDGADGKAALDATLALPAEGGARLDALRGDLFGVPLAGDVAMTADGLVTGKLKGENAPLAALSRFAGLGLGGTGTLALEAEASGGRQNIAFSLDTPRMTIEEDMLTLDRVSLNATANDIGGKAEINGKLSAASGQAGVTRIASFGATAQGPLSALALTANVSGTRESFKSEAVSLEAAALYASARDRLTVSALAFSIGQSSMALAEPATLDVSKGLSISGASFDMKGPGGAGRTRADFVLGARAVRLHLDTEHLPLELVTPLFLSQAAHGTAAGKVDLDSAKGTGAASLRFEGVRLASADEREQPAFNATLDGSWAKERLDLAARAEGVSTSPFDLKASLPLIRDPEGAWPMLAQKGPVSASLDWEGPLASLVALADVQGQQLSGNAKIALSAGGDISAPRVSGRATIANGVYENFDSGTMLRNLSVNLEGREDESLHFTLEASDGGKGRVSAAGDVRLARSAFPAISINATFAKARLVQTAEADISFDGKLELMGPAFPPTEETPLTLKGALTTTQAEIHIPDRLPGSVAEIDVIEINGAPARRAAAEKSSPLPLMLDLGVKIGSPARVSGRNLDSLWTGDLTISGRADNPRIGGTLTSLRGSFDLAGKSFALKKGAVRFLDRTPIDPDIDVNLAYARSDLTATIAVSGRSSAPEIAFTSTPDLPRDEILSRILFDKGAGELTAMEAAQLANTLAQLSGKGGLGGVGVLDAIQKSLGLDVLQVGTAQSGATTVAAGKYIQKGVYVGVEQGTLASDSSVKVEIEITPQISVDTRIGQDASGDVGVNWKWDY